MASIISVCDAETQLEALVERAAAGEEIVIAKDGVSRARLVGMPRAEVPRIPANAMRLTYIAADFDEASPLLRAMFDGRP